MTIVVDARSLEHTLQEILDVRPAQIRAGLSDEQLMQAAAGGQADFRAWLKVGGPLTLSDQMAEHVCGLFDIEVAEIFAGAWRTYEEIKRCARETRNDISRICEIALTEHDFVCEMKADVEVLVNGKKLTSIPFTISTTWNVQSLTLCLKRCGVYKVRSGTCDCTAEIKCADAAVWQRAVASISLPGELKFETPLMIDD